MDNEPQEMPPRKPWTKPELRRADVSSTQVSPGASSDGTLISTVDSVP